jgi:hypothetical protein
VHRRPGLADDPGAGKTIMAGLYIKELLLRADLHRCLIVAPSAWWITGRKSCTPNSGWSSVDTEGLMRRMAKEELLTFEGKPLFPERCAYTVPYALSGAEQELYELVTQYVREEMNRADRLKAAGEGRRSNTVGFALTILQRRLASSPEAIWRSLERRRTPGTHPARTHHNGRSGAVQCVR